MSSERQIAKQQIEENEVYKPKGRITQRILAADAPIIIKGSAQGPEPELELESWSLTSEFQLIETTEGGEKVYTLPSKQFLGGFKILDSKGEQIFEFPTLKYHGDYTIEFSQPER